ncbi:solute carrier organic anion transporter family member 4C1-like [Tubulanus polymorphus]|uniref:solute carrier organic anion transporter family member 4C1-like n=1 Tax=Tubulanus polymorphus TaxID=672921 RepID=UPI003DA2077D
MSYQQEKDQDDDLTDEEAEAVACGYGKCKPAFIQGWNNSKTILAMVSLFGLIQGFVAMGIVGVNTATIEKRFHLSSTQAGLIASSYDIASGIAVLPLSYFGRSCNMPRWLGFSCLAVSMGSFIMSLPHFITPTYESTLVVSDVCMGNTTICLEGATNELWHLQNCLYVFILGQLMHGLGGTTLFIIGTVYLDENVHTHNSPLYVGIFQSTTALGPAIGFVAGGMLLKLYVDVDTINSTILYSSEDPRWIGAWWIAYLISSFCALICSALFFCFGKETKGARLVRKYRQSQAHNDGSEDLFRQSNFGEQVRDLPRVTWILLKNPTFISLSLAACCSQLVVQGFGNFLAKYVENQFSQTASFSAIVTGAVVVPGAAGALLLGGVISKKLELKVRGMLRLCALSITVAVLASAVFFARCDAPKIAGINHPYTGANVPQLSHVNLTDRCNDDCNCLVTSNQPICGVDGVQYFTACHAGCKHIKKIDEGNYFYSDCACIEADPDVVANSSVSQAKTGVCETYCYMLPVFLVFLVMVVFFTLLPLTPGISVSLRVVPGKTRTYALGVQWILIRFLGSIPGPILFGVVMDSSCLLWQDKCDEKGSCMIYDSYLMSISMYGLGIGVGIVALFFGLVALLMYKPPDEATTYNMNGEIDRTPTETTFVEPNGGSATAMKVMTAAS